MYDCGVNWKRSDLKDAVLAAVRALGGRAHLIQIAKYIWDNHKNELEASPLLYTWQYDMRWAATRLRQEKVLKSAESSDKGIWELA